jgi:hypothetical protein
MSRQSKQAKRLQAAREISKTRVAGGHGPSSTTPKHGKKNAWWQKFRSYADFIKGPKKTSSGKKNAVAEEGIELA